MQYFQTKFIFITLICALSRKYVGAVPFFYWSVDGNKFLIETDQKFNWFEALDECNSRNLQLITIDTPTKNQQISDILQALFGNNNPSLWIGANDHLQGGDKARPFYWSSSGRRMTFSNFASGQPDNLNGIEHCVEIWGNAGYKWNDESCSSNLGYICEKL